MSYKRACTNIIILTHVSLIITSSLVPSRRHFVYAAREIFKINKSFDIQNRNISLLVSLADKIILKATEREREYTIAV